LTSTSKAVSNGRTGILKLAGIAESISVEGGTAMDVERSGLASRSGDETLDAIPVRRFSMFDFIKAAPGVSPTSPSSGVDPSVSIFGSGVFCASERVRRSAAGNAAPG
jgi:hypothetical protein